MAAFGTLKRAKGKVDINKEWCKGCEFCVAYCPTDVLQMATEYNQKGYHPPYVKSEQECVSCQLCEIICPEFAIRVTTVEQDAEQG